MKITYENEPEKNEVTPTMEYIDFEVELGHINRLLGINIDQAKVAECAEKMGICLLPESNGETLKVRVPPIRSDVLHACDVVEDIGIGYGFNNIARVFPPTNTVGSF